MKINQSYNNNPYHMISANSVHKVLWTYRSKVFHRMKETGKKMVSKKEKGKVQGR